MSGQMLLHSIRQNKLGHSSKPSENLRIQKRSQENFKRSLISLLTSRYASCDMCDMRFRRVLYRLYIGDATPRRPRNWGLWRFTRAGLLVWIALFVTAAIGLDTRATVVYRGFAIIVALLVVSVIWSLFFRVHLTITRNMPKFGTVGEPLEYALHIRNDSDRPQHELLLYDQVEEPRPTLEEFLYTAEPGEEQRNLYDRTFLVYRLYWLLAMKRGVKTREHPLPPLAAHGEQELRMTLTPFRRGYIQFEHVLVHRPDPLNLFKASVRIPLPHSLLILPKRYTLPPFALPGKRKFKSGGMTLASSVGDSEEFVSLRDYRPGDPLRHIHWKSWAKTGSPIVKEFQGEYFVRHALVLDTFQQAEFSNVFEEAVSLAASFACTIRTQESLLDLMFVGPEAYCFTAGRGLGHTEQMLEILASVRPCRDKLFQTLPPMVIERAAWLSGCICIFLDWDAARQQFVQALHALAVPLLVFVMTEKTSEKLFDPTLIQEMPGVLYQLQVGQIQEGLHQL